MENKRQIVVIILVVIVFLLIIISGVTMFLLLQKNSTNSITEIPKKDNNVVQEKQTEITIKTDEEIFISYLLDSVEKIASQGYILKSTNGDVTSPKLTKSEANNNRAAYALKLKGVISNKEIVPSTYEKDGKKHYIYDLQKVLDSLELSTHMGVGTGITDSRGMKLYILGQDIIQTKSEQIITNEDIMYEFDFAKDKFVNYLLDSVEKIASKGYILKSIDGDVTAPKLTLQDAKNNRQTYKEKLNNTINNLDICTELYLENETLNCKYNVELFLNSLDIGTHMGIGIEADENGDNIFSW